MPLDSSSIKFYYSDGATGVANATLSLGGTISASTIPDNTANNLFDDVTGDESASGIVEYRGFFVKDVDSVYTMINPKIWILGYTRSADTYDVMSIASSTFMLGANTMGTCADTTTPPSETAGSIIWAVESATGQTFPSNTIGFTSGSIASTTSAQWANTTLAAGSYFGLWVRRSVPANASAYNDRKCTIRIQCETTASPWTTTVYTDYVITWFGIRDKDGALPLVEAL